MKASASAIVIEEVDLFDPSSKLISPAVDVTPSNMFSSAVVDVTPSIIFNSAVVAVTPSIIFNSDAVAVTPSSMFNSDAVDVIAVPAICSVVAFTSPLEPYTTALLFTIVPALDPSTKFNSAAVEVTPSRILSSAVVDVTPSIIFNSAAVADIAVPLKFISSKYATPSMYMSFHSLLEEPKSYVPSSSGIIFESTSPPNTILSVLASPKVTVPPLNVVVPVTVKLPPTAKLPATEVIPSNTFVPSQ